MGLTKLDAAVCPVYKWNMPAIPLDLAFAEFVVDMAVASVASLTMQHTPMKIFVVVAATEEEVYQPSPDENCSAVTLPMMPTLLNYDHHS